MLNSQRFQIQNTFPVIKASGLSPKKCNLTVKELLFHNKENQTPEKLKKYRKSNLLQVGKTTLHHHNYDDVQQLDQNKIHGVQSTICEKMDTLIRNKDMQGFLFHVNENQEKIYKSEKIKPHGKALSRNYQYPIEVFTENFKFGVKTLEDEKNEPQQNQTEEELIKTKKLYQKSHNYYDPGEQVNRNYDWTINPNNHSFGLKEKNRLEFKECFIPEQQQTQIVPQNVKNFKKIYQDNIGKSKTNKINPIFEYPQYKQEKIIGVKESLIQEVQSSENKDMNLGRSIKPGLTNIPKIGDENKVFGLSTETIIHKKLNLKQQNKISFFDLLNYNYDNQLGECEEELLKKRSKQDLKQQLYKMQIQNYDEFLDGIMSEEQEMSFIEFLNTLRQHNIQLNQFDINIIIYGKLKLKKFKISFEINGV